MKTRIPIAIALIIFSAQTFALDIDITNHPDKDFILGYKHNYPVDCDVMWWASQWGTEHIIGVGECDGISKEEAMADMNSLMAAVKKSYPRFNNFSEYFRWKEETSKTSQSPTPKIQFCVYVKGRTYLFSNTPSQKQEGWNIVYLMKSERSSMENVATWKSFGENAVADVHGERFMIWDFDKEACRTTTPR